MKSGIYIFNSKDRNFVYNYERNEVYVKSFSCLLWVLCVFAERCSSIRDLLGWRMVFRVVLGARSHLKNGRSLMGTFWRPILIFSRLEIVIWPDFLLSFLTGMGKWGVLLTRKSTISETQSLQSYYASKKHWVGWSWISAGIWLLNQTFLLLLRI